MTPKKVAVRFSAVSHVGDPLVARTTDAYMTRAVAAAARRAFVAQIAHGQFDGEVTATAVFIDEHLCRRGGEGRVLPYPHLSVLDGDWS